MKNELATDVCVGLPNCPCTVGLAKAWQWPEALASGFACLVWLAVVRLKVNNYSNHNVEAVRFLFDACSDVPWNSAFGATIATWVKQKHSSPGC